MSALRKALVHPDFSKETRDALVAELASDQVRFDELMELFYAGTEREITRAAWIMRTAGELNPRLIKPHLNRMTQYMRGEVPDAVLRNTLGLFQGIKLPADLWGEVAEVGFDLLNDPKRPAAIRVHAMSTLLNIVKQVPELKQELQLVVEAHLPFGSAGFQSRGKKVLAALRKL